MPMVKSAFQVRFAAQPIVQPEGVTGLFCVFRKQIAQRLTQMLFALTSNEYFEQTDFVILLKPE